MRSRVLLFLGIVTAAFILSARQAAAQQCYSYSGDLGEYVSISSDGTNIYSEVAIDGSEDMTLWGQCAEFGGAVVHTPWVLNQLSANGQTVGGWQPGTGVCGSCYISSGVEEEIAPGPGGSADCHYEVQLDCNFGGDIFDSGSGSESLSNCTVSVPQPSSVTAAGCQGTASQRGINATISPNTGECVWVPSQSGCNAGKAQGQVNLENDNGDPSLNPQSPNPQCLVTFYAGPTGPPWPASGSNIGTFIAGFSISFGGTPVTAQGTVNVYCP